jgi:hypothetical protein
MTNLQQAWGAWRTLSQAERARFLMLLRETYAREREAVLRRNGGGYGVRATSLQDPRDRRRRRHADLSIARLVVQVVLQQG